MTAMEMGMKELTAKELARVTGDNRTESYLNGAALKSGQKEKKTDNPQ